MEHGASLYVLDTVPRRKEEMDALVLKGGVGYVCETSVAGEGATVGDCSGEGCTERSRAASVSSGGSKGVVASARSRSIFLPAMAWLMSSGDGRLSKLS
jgi:hypothetical protein